MTDVIEFNDGNTGVSADAPENMQEYFQQMIEMNVPVRDGDDLITFYEEDPEDDDNEEIELGINDDDTLNQNPQDNHPPVNLEEASKRLDESQAGFEQMKSAALERGVTAEQMDAMEQEYAKEGKLSDSSFALLEQIGYPRAFIQNYIDGQTALANSYIQGFIQSVGGQDSFNNAIQVLQQTAPHLIDTLDGAIGRRDLATATGILTLAGNLQAQTTAAQQAAQQVAQAQKYGQPAQRSLTQTAMPVVATTPKGFASKQEMVAAMNDKRYGRDMAYTEEVRNKVAHAPW